MAPPVRIKVRSKHKQFAPIGSVREVTKEEARVLELIGRAELVRDSPAEVPARVIVPVTREMRKGRNQ